MFKVSVGCGCDVVSSLAQQNCELSITRGIPHNLT